MTFQRYNEKLEDYVDLDSDCELLEKRMQAEVICSEVSYSSLQYFTVVLLIL